MKTFRTILVNEPSSSKITLKDKLLTLGSCFSHAIGQKLKENKFQAVVNPFGAIYSPIALHRLLTYATSNAPVPRASFLQTGDVYLNYYFHSSFSSLQQSALEKKITELISTVHSFISDCQYIFMTYGTAWIYSRADNHDVVANCHKQPSHLFDKSLLSVNEIVESFEETNRLIQSVNKNVKIILTISPVRHLKDSIELNSVSKAILRTACHDLAEKFAHVEYFPAYEIMMDDLRDYRFYKADMIHPNEQAEDYIWDLFVEKYMDKSTADFLREWKKIHASLKHRPFNVGSSGHQNFLKQTLKKLTELKSIIDVDAEIQIVQAQLLDSFTSNKIS